MEDEVEDDEEGVIESSRVKEWEGVGRGRKKGEDQKPGQSSSSSSSIRSQLLQENCVIIGVVSRKIDTRNCRRA